MNFTGKQQAWRNNISGLEVFDLPTVAWLICCIQQLLFIVSVILSFDSRFSSCCSEDKCQSGTSDLTWPTGMKVLYSTAVAWLVVIDISDTSATLLRVMNSSSVHTLLNNCCMKLHELLKSATLRRLTKSSSVQQLLKQSVFFVMETLVHILLLTRSCRLSCCYVPDSKGICMLQ